MFSWNNIISAGYQWLDWINQSSDHWSSGSLFQTAYLHNILITFSLVGVVFWTASLHGPWTSMKREMEVDRVFWQSGISICCVASIAGFYGFPVFMFWLVVTSYNRIEFQNFTRHHSSYIGFNFIKNIYLVKRVTFLITDIRRCVNSLTPELTVRKYSLFRRFEVSSQQAIVPENPDLLRPLLKKPFAHHP